MRLEEPKKPYEIRVFKILPAYLAIFWAIFAFFAPNIALGTNVATTTLHVDICGDGNITGAEICDDGPGNNTGAYSSTTANRHCTPSCGGFGPYCGDTVLQALYAEECDDGNAAAGDRCDLTCKIENLPTGGGGGSGPFVGGSYTPPSETRVSIQGKAYPNAQVSILRDGETIGVVQADGKADFFFTTTNVSAGVATFGFWAQDSEGFKSVALSVTLTITSGAGTTISGAYVPPTITSDKRSVGHGEEITFSGQSAPSVKIETHINSEETVIREAQTDASGKWKMAFNTLPLASEDFHTAKALFETVVGGNAAKSSFSQAISFYVGEKDIGRRFAADLNHDGRVNLIDFSILLFYWNTSGPTGDINEDKKVNLSDFSIMLFYWTG